MSATDVYPPYEASDDVPRWGRLRRPIVLALATAPVLLATFLFVARPLWERQQGGFRTAFDHGDAGWDQFRSMAESLPTELGPALGVKGQLWGLDRAQPGGYYVDSARYPLHYDFARRVWPIRLHGLTRQVFDWYTYDRPDRAQLATTLTWYPDLHLSEAQAGGLDPLALPLEAPVVLQFFATDQPSTAELVLAYRLSLDGLAMLEREGGRRRLVYAPTSPVQGAHALAHAAELAEVGILWLPEDELLAGIRELVLQPGEAYGTLRAVDAGELREGTFGRGDILVLDDLPLDLPVVAATITRQRQTPLSHVNVLARARGTPNVVLTLGADDPRVRPLLGKLVHLTAGAEGIRLEAVSAAEADAGRAGAPQARTIPPAQRDGPAVLDLGDLSAADGERVGAKAANLAELHRLMPEVAPGGLAVSFGPYARHMGASRLTLSECPKLRELCEEDAREEDREDDIPACARAESWCDSALAPRPMTLAAYAQALTASPELRADGPARAAALHGLRRAVRRAEVDPTFVRDLRAAVRGRFGDATVRLRSSTNAEDLPGFTGAGLYTSLSASLDGDKPVEERITEVWASVWRWQAVEEREHWGIPHGEVQMAALIGPSHPDEAANGVIITGPGGADDRLPPGWQAYVNVQLGEASVTNPENGDFPEVFIARRHWTGWRFRTLQQSSLFPYGPMLGESERVELARYAWKAHQHFARLAVRESTGAEPRFELEFKFDGPERRLVIKQIRRYGEP